MLCYGAAVYSTTDALWWMRVVYRSVCVGGVWCVVCDVVCGVVWCVVWCGVWCVVWCVMWCVV